MATLSGWIPQKIPGKDPEVERRYEKLAEIPPVVDRGEDNVPETVYEVRTRADGTVVVTFPGGKPQFFDGFHISQTMETQKLYDEEGRCTSILPTGEGTLQLTFARRRVF